MCARGACLPAYLPIYLSVCLSTCLPVRYISRQTIGRCRQVHGAEGTFAGDSHASAGRAICSGNLLHHASSRHLNNTVFAPSQIPHQEPRTQMGLRGSHPAGRRDLGGVHLNHVRLLRSQVHIPEARLSLWPRLQWLQLQHATWRRATPWLSRQSTLCPQFTNHRATSVSTEWEKRREKSPVRI